MKNSSIQQNSSEQISTAWERAVEQAAADIARHESANPQELNVAAGLRVQSGVNAGNWISDYTHTNCGFSCAC